MSTVIKDLGAATAYGYAVEKGYTGTEEEFAELMASYATVGQTAVDAKNAAVAAKTAAQTAATTATNKASEATTAAQTATTKAGEAQTSAQTASNKASEASQSASQASGYAQTAETAKTDAQTAKTQAETARDNAVTAKTAAETAQGKAETAQGAAEDAAQSVSASASQIAKNTADILKAFPTDTAWGAVASFTDGADNIPLKSLVVDIDPVQDLSNGDPSPENSCPISGWTGMQISVTGANIWGGEKMADDMVAVASAYDSSAVIKGEDENGRYVRIPARNSIANKVVFDRFKDNERYTFILKVGKSGSLNTVNIIIVYTDGTYTMCNIPTTTEVTNNAYTYAVVSTAGKTVSAVKFSWQGGNTYLYYDESGVFEGVLTADDFEPFGTTIPISWADEAGTVYGGRLDVLSGKLTVFPYYASYNGETLTGEWISDRDVYAVGTTPTIGAQVVNIGAVGTEYQLEAHDVASLLGQNNIWADTGDCSVEYRADTKLYIEKLTQPEEDDMIADSAITSGQFFMVGNTLYRALANIASGATITVGTNAQRVSLTDALNLVNA